MYGSHLCFPINETDISKTELWCSVSQFLHSYICERFTYFQDMSAYSAAGIYVFKSWEFINRPQTYKSGNWDRGRAIPRKGIHKWYFSCSVGIPVREAKFCLQLVLPPLNLRQNVKDAVTRRCRHAECHATECIPNLTSHRRPKWPPTRPPPLPLPPPIRNIS